MVSTKNNLLGPRYISSHLLLLFHSLKQLSNVLSLPRGKSLSILHSIFGVIFIGSIFFSQCTPPPEIHICPQPFWKKYAAFQPNDIKQEITRLEELLAEKKKTTSVSVPDTTDSTGTHQLSELEIILRLFELSIHHFNREYDFNKIYEYSTYLYQQGGQDSLRYLNWNRPARVLNELVQERDSLKTAISEIVEMAENSDVEQKQAKLISKLRKDIKIYEKQRDSLSAVITSQQEAIMKLQKLDVLMEQQRNKIQ